MGETLGISHNVFEKVEREKDRKERLKKYEEWQKEHVKKKAKLKEMRSRIRVVEKNVPSNNSSASLGNIADDVANPDSIPGSEGNNSPDEFGATESNEETELVDEHNHIPATANEADFTPLEAIPNQASVRPKSPDQRLPNDLHVDTQQRPAQSSNRHQDDGKNFTVETEDFSTRICGNCQIL